MAGNEAKGQRGRGQGAAGLLLRVRGHRGPDQASGSWASPVRLEKGQGVQTRRAPENLGDWPQPRPAVRLPQKVPPPRILPEYPPRRSDPPGRSVFKAKLLSVNKCWNRQNSDSGRTGRALPPASPRFPPGCRPHRHSEESHLPGRAPVFSSLFFCIRLTLSHLTGQSENHSNTALPSFTAHVSSPFPLFSSLKKNFFRKSTTRRTTTQAPSPKL